MTKKMVAFALGLGWLLSCGQQGDSSGDSPADVGSDSASDRVQADCEAYLACLLDTAPETYPGALGDYGDRSACWDTSQQAASCEEVCRMLLDEIREGGSCLGANAMPGDMGPDADLSSPPGFVYPNEKVACQPNPAFEEQAAILQGGKNNPTGRGEQGGVFDPCHDRIILFGGNDQQPEECASFGPKNYLGDTWLYAMEYENWVRINTQPAPPARGRHAYAFDPSRKRMMIFGGRFRPSGQNSGDYTLFQDLWAFDVNTDTWSQIQATGEIPAPRANSAMVYDPTGDRLLLLGGSTSPSGLQFSPSRELFSLDLETSVWTRISSDGPPARLFHAMVVDTANSLLLVFGGGDENAFLGPFFRDVWAFSFASSTWEVLWNPAPAEYGPLARINARMIDDPDRSRVLLFGGHDDASLGNTNDLWAFDAATRQWTELRGGDRYTGQGCTSFCSCPENFVTYDQESPERRQYHTFAAVHGEATALLFGGSGDCGYMDDTWSLDLATGTWQEVHAAEQGIACARTGRENCEELCY